MGDSERSALIKQLRNAMSDLWEDAYCASWMNVPSEIEDVCRRALESNAPAWYGEALIAVDRARELWKMAERLGGWILEKYVNGDAETTLLPFTPLGSTRDPTTTWPREGWSPDDL